MHAIAAAARRRPARHRVAADARRGRGGAPSCAGFEGIGPFYAELVTVRALGHTDVLPATEPRVVAATAARLGRESLSPADFAEVAEAWRPWRTWACVALRAPPHYRKAPGGRPPEDGLEAGVGRTTGRAGAVVRLRTG